MSERPPTPPALLALIVGRGSFAQTWQLAGKMNAMDAVAQGLAKNGWGVSDIVAALRNHPDREMTEDDAVDAARRAVDSFKPVLEASRQADAPEPRIVRVMCQRPRTYDVEFAGEEFTAGTQAIASRSAFRMACLDNTATVPSLPPAKKFDAWLEAQLAQAEKVEQPPEASADGMETEFIEDLIASTPQGEEMAEIREVRWVAENGYRYLHAASMWRLRVRQMMPTITGPRFAAILRSLGWLPHEYTGKDFRAKTWRQAWDAVAQEPWSVKMARERADADARQAAEIERQYAQVDKGMFDE